MILMLKGHVKGYTRRDGTYVGPHFRRAVRFAVRKHKGQLRGDGKTPYIAHPLKVAHILRQHANVNDPHVLAAAVLHDTLEDTDTSYDELRSLFGAEVADVVLEVTNDNTLPKPQQKQAQIDKAPTLSARASQVKIADKIANLADIIQAPPAWSPERKRAYYEHARAVVDNMREPHPLLRELFEMVYREGLARIR